MQQRLQVNLRKNDFIAGRLIDHIEDAFAALLGPRRPSLKFAAIGVVALAVVFAFAKAEHRVTAKSVLEPELQRVLVRGGEANVRATQRHGMIAFALASARGARRDNPVTRAPQRDGRHRRFDGEIARDRRFIHAVAGNELVGAPGVVGPAVA